MQPALAARDLIGAALWLGAFTFEVVADRQKSAWRTARDNKEHDEKFSAPPKPVPTGLYCGDSCDLARAVNSHFGLMEHQSTS